MPELTKPTTITDVADEDWITAVTPVPSRIPLIGVLIENQLELIARHPFQSVAHQAHTEQEQGNAAQKCDTVRNRHTRISSHFKLLYYYTGKSSICRWVPQNCSVNL